MRVIRFEQFLHFRNSFNIWGKFKNYTLNLDFETSSVQQWVNLYKKVEVEASRPKFIKIFIYMIYMELLQIFLSRLDGSTRIINREILDYSVLFGVLRECTFELVWCRSRLESGVSLCRWFCQYKEKCLGTRMIRQQIGNISFCEDEG